jgi:hypothetical protein
MIEKMQAYRAKLLKAGKLLEARAVAYCIKLAKDGS